MRTCHLDGIPVFFVIGRPRSGTTMLRTILDAHPNVSIPLESRVISFLHRKYKNISIWDESKLLEFYDDIFKQPKINTWIINEERLKSQILGLGKKANFIRLIKLLYLNYESFFDKNTIQIIGDKNPGYSYNISELRTMLKLFPNAKIIHLTRDYRDHYLSMSKIDFEGNHLSLVCYRWKYSFNQVRKTMVNNMNNYYFIRYEDLVLNPKSEVVKICNFLNIPYDEDMVHYYRIKDKVLAIHTQEEVDRYHSKLFHPISSDFIYGWKRKLSKRQIELADSVVGKTGLSAGYERVLKKNNIWYKLVVIPDIIYSNAWFVFNTIYLKIVPLRFQTNKSIMSNLYFKLFKKK